MHATLGQPDLPANRSAVTALKRYYPGLSLAITAGLAATFLSEHYGAPVMLMALMIGMIFNPVADGTVSEPGIEFASKALLRAGVALLGLRVSVADITSLGTAGFGAIVGLVTGTILLGVLLSRNDRSFGFLTGGAVAICGASAALALSACLPKSDAREKDTLFTVVAVTAMSTLAMIVYPIVLVSLGLSEAQTAFVLGTSIHDVAQVVGAGLSVSPETARLAVLVKMVRVSLLPLILLGLVLMSAASGKRADGAKIPVPGFLVVFFVLAILANIGAVSEAAITFAVAISKWLLVVAIAALGARTSLRSLATVGSAKVLQIAWLTLILFGAATVVSRFLLDLS